MIESGYEESVANKFFAFANDIAGILSISLSATAMQFQHPEPFAWFFLVIILLWIQSHSSEYRRIKDFYLKRHKGLIGNITLFWKVKIFAIGLTCLFLVAIGELSTKNVYSAIGI